MKNLQCQTKAIEVSLTNRVQDVEERISGLEDNVEEIDHSVNEYVIYKKATHKKIQEIWEIMKRQNLQIKDMEEGEKTQAKGTANIYNK